MDKIDDRSERDFCPQAWMAATRNVAVNHLLERICPVCDDVDRAILGASLGG